MTLSVRGPDELVAAIPHLLGFQPEESIVFIPMRSELPIARVDIPTTPRDREMVWHSIGDAYGRHSRPGSSVAIVCLCADRENAEVVGQDFVARLESIGIDTHVLMWADDTRWADLDTGDMGLRTDAAREHVASMSVLAGRPQPAASRDSLAATLVGDPEPVAALLPAAEEAAAASTPRAEGRWALGRLKQFHHDGHRLSDGDSARLLVALDSTPIRDSLWDDMSPSNVTSHVALWTDLTKRAPDDVRAEPASLLGFASWLSGSGAMAWCALDQIPEGKQTNLAGLVASAVQGGVNPRVWETAKAKDTAREVDSATDLVARRATAQSATTRPAHGI
jgi:hypothetical protein